MNAVNLFQDIQRLYGICPCCGALFRLSDAQMFHSDAPPETVFDKLAKEWEKLELAQERLAEDEGRLRERARSQGRREAMRRLDRLVRFFKRQRIEVRDLRLVFHPVDYVAFRGLSKGDCAAVEFIDHVPDTSEREQLQRSIERCIAAGNFEWINMRIEDSGRVCCT